MLPVWSVKGIRAKLKTVSGPRAHDVSLQLCEMLPLAAVAETNNVTGAVRDDRCFLIDISSVRGCMYFWSLLCMPDARGAASEQLDLECVFDSSDSEAEAPEGVVASDRARRGRPRLEDSASLGHQFVEWVQGFVHSRGQFRVSDQHRVCETCEVFGAPLRLIAKNAQDMDWDLSHSGIYNLFAPPRDNATRSACRGLIYARPAAAEAKEKAFHPRGRFSSVMVRYAEDLGDILLKSGICKVRRYHVDGMANTPTWIPARRGGKVGFFLRRAGTPSLSIADYDFPLAERTTLSLYGWVRSEFAASSQRVRSEFAGSSQRVRSEFVASSYITHALLAYAGHMRYAV